MRSVFFDVLEINIAVAILLVLLLPFLGRFRKRYGARWMKYIWILFAFRLLIPYNFSLPTTDIRFFNVPGFEQKDSVSQEIQENEQQVIRHYNENDNKTNLVDVVDEEPMLSNNVSESKPDIQQNQVNTQVSGALEQTLDQPMEQADGENDTEVSKNAQPVYRYSLASIMAFIWIIVAGINIVLLLVKYSFFLIKIKREITNAAIQTRIEKLDGAKISVCESSKIKSPMLFGVFRTKLIIPASMYGWDRDVQDMVLLHELAHLYSKDLLLKAVMNFACCMNWFNPLVYYLRKQFFYDMELACDEMALSLKTKEEKAKYAKALLMLAKGKHSDTAFTTGFGESKKSIKGRIDYLFHGSKRKRGMIGISVIVMVFMGATMLISCGYKPEEKENEQIVSKDGQSTDVHNHWYNGRIRVYNDKAFLAETDGIYLIDGETGDKQLLFANKFSDKRGFEIYADKLYFCGSIEEKAGRTSTVYCMNLSDYTVQDLMKGTDPEYCNFRDLSIYENGLYLDSSFGFMLDEIGQIIGAMDSSTDDFLYREYLEYKRLEKDRSQLVVGTTGYNDILKKQSNKYEASMDVAACKKLLNGKQIVTQYKDESSRRAYMENTDGTYEYLCDLATYPEIITEHGMYYLAGSNSATIWYYDFDSGEQTEIYDGESAKGVQMLNYELDRIYFLQIEYEDSTYHYYLMSVTKDGKDITKIYRFKEKEISQAMNRLNRNCCIYNNRMYIVGMEPINLLSGENVSIQEPSISPKSINMLYQDMIEMAREAIKTRGESIPEGYKLSSVFRMGVQSYETLGYLVKDINGDGIDELIFGENATSELPEWDGIIYDIFTIVDGKLVQVLNGWERNRYYLCENGIIANEGSSSASESQYSYFLFDGNKIQLIESVLYYASIDNQDNPWFYSTTDEYWSENAEPISEEEATAIQNKYTYVHPTFTPFE